MKIKQQPKSPPKFELFADRIEITSAGPLPEGLSESEFFEGVSIPRNRELMRVYRDLALVEELGSGVPRIMESYGKECFRFMENFTRMTFPATEQVTEQVENLIAAMNGEHSRNELMQLLNLTRREHFRSEYLQKVLELGLIELTIPNKPSSSKQRYRLTKIGQYLKGEITGELMARLLTINRSNLYSYCTA